MAGSTDSSDSDDPSQRTVIAPPVELYVFVNGAGPDGEAIVVEVEELELLDDDEVLDDDELADWDCPDTPPSGLVGDGAIEVSVVTVEVGAIEAGATDATCGAGVVTGVDEAVGTGAVL